LPPEAVMRPAQDALGRASFVEGMQLGAGRARRGFPYACIDLVFLHSVLYYHPEYP
jgi:hypothetical protein